MTCRGAPEFNLRAINQHFLSVDIFLLTPKRCLGAATKPKTCMLRLKEMSKYVRREASPQKPNFLDSQHELEIDPDIKENTQK